MNITRNGSRPSGRGPAEHFIGTVRIDPLFQAPEPARVAATPSRSSPAQAEHGGYHRAQQHARLTL